MVGEVGCEGILQWELRLVKNLFEDSRRLSGEILASKQGQGVAHYSN